MKHVEGEGISVETHLFGTINGVIGVAATLSLEQFTYFDKLQQQITKVIKGVGGFRHDQWRAFANERKVVDAKNFIDGDLIESFLDLKRDKMEEVAKGLQTTVEDLVKHIQSLTQAIH